MLSPFHLNTILFSCLLCMGVLPVCMSVQHALLVSEEDRVRVGSPGARVTEGCELISESW